MTKAELQTKSTDEIRRLMSDFQEDIDNGDEVDYNRDQQMLCVEVLSERQQERGIHCHCKSCGI